MNGIANSATQPSCDDSRAGLEDRVPLRQFLGVVELELVGAPARRADLEVVGVAAGLAGIEIDHHRIGREDLPVALHVTGDDGVGRAVVVVEREIEIVLVVENAHHRAFGRGFVGIGRPLREIVDDRRFRPRGIRRSASITGASAVSIRTALMLGRMKGGGDGRLTLACIDALAPTSISVGGASRAGNPARRERARPTHRRPPSAQTKIAAGAIAPLALLPLRTPPPPDLLPLSSLARIVTDPAATEIPVLVTLVFDARVPGSHRRVRYAAGSMGSSYRVLRPRVRIQPL